MRTRLLLIAALGLLAIGGVIGSMLAVSFGVEEMSREITWDMLDCPYTERAAKMQIKGDGYHDYDNYTYFWSQKIEGTCYAFLVSDWDEDLIVPID